ncbi:MAG: hypothetical protein OQK49_08155 [Proteobacteria bacterium]|nr:hypothetical protein [Pseudomonadota bacterium]
MNKNYLMGLISLECQNSTKQTLEKIQATALGDQVASELSRVLKLTPETSLVLAAASYPTEAILTPGFMIHQNLIKYASAVFQGEQQQHRVLAIGGHQRSMPDGLQPPESSAPLMHVPFVLISEDQAVKHRFEDTLLDKGMVSPPTYQILSDFFESQIVHANYMTHLDLIAMMHNHYNQVGMHHLWQVIETALLSNQPRLDTEQNQQSFCLRGQSVYMPFYSLQSYCAHNPECSQQDYIHWLMAQRLATEVFQSHGLKCLFYEASQTSQPPNDDSLETHLIKRAYYHDQHISQQRPSVPQLVDYIHPKAGYVWSVLTETNGQQHWFYPLNQSGQKAIDNHLETEHRETYQVANKQKQRLDGRLQESSGCH